MDTVHLGCEHVRQALSPYFHSGLTDEWSTAVERHLLDCHRCLDEYSAWGQLLDYLYTFRVAVNAH